MSYVVNHSADRDRQRLVSTWVDRQIHDEFEILAKQKGTTKAALWRELIVQFVASELSRHGIGGSNAAQDTPAA